MPEISGLINHILPQSFVDGPGNRAVVFLQGCNFNCLYCHNPFTIQVCNHCGQCVPGCPAHSLTIISGKVHWDPSICSGCDHCVQICPHSSSPKTIRMSAESLWGELREISPFISGISVSGGEPSLQVPFLTELFSIVKASSHLTTLIETNAFAPPEDYQPLLPHLDFVLADLKVFDEEKHIRLTGKPLREVLETIVFLAEKKKLHAIQQVIAPGMTDNDENITATAAFIAGLNPEIHLKLLRFRPHGTRGAARAWASPDDQTMDHLVATAKAQGLKNVHRSL